MALAEPRRWPIHHTTNVVLETVDNRNHGNVMFWGDDFGDQTPLFAETVIV
jgi:hypothetical protein